MQENKELFLAPIHPFTKREADILKLIIKGHTYKQIAQTLGINEKTARNIVCDANARSYGLFQKIEEIVGTRPGNKREMLSMLVDDVVLLKEVNVNADLP